MVEMVNLIESIDFSKMASQIINNASLLYANNPKLTYLCVFSFAFFVYYYKAVVKRPRLICKNGKFKDFLIKNCGRMIEKPIYPTFWAFNTYAQTILANLVRSTLPKLTFEREVIVMKDGGEVALDWYKDEDKPKDSLIVCLMPGLTGDSHTEYITSLVSSIGQTGVRCCVMINRGRGGQVLKTPRLYCASNCEDAEELLEHLKATNPNSKLLAIGISLGGIVLGRYLALKGEKALIDAGMLISVCYDFFAGYRSLENNRLNMLLNRHLSRSLKAIMIEQRDVLERSNSLDYDAIMKCNTLKELDSEITCKMWGYPKVEDYYTDATLKDRLHLIKKPVLCLNAADDIFQPFEALPLDQFEKSSYLALLLTSRGGHIGHMDHCMAFTPFYIERLVIKYINALLSLDNIDNIKETTG